MGGWGDKGSLFPPIPSYSMTHGEHAQIQKLSLWLKDLGPLPQPPLCKQSQARYLTKSSFLLHGLWVWGTPTPRPKGVRGRSRTPSDLKSHLFATKWAAVAALGAVLLGLATEFQWISLEGWHPLNPNFFDLFCKPKGGNVNFVEKSCAAQQWGKHGAQWGPMGPWGPCGCVAIPARSMWLCCHTITTHMAVLPYHHDPCGSCVAIPSRPMQLLCGHTLNPTAPAWPYP